MSDILAESCKTREEINKINFKCLKRFQTQRELLTVNLQHFQPAATRGQNNTRKHEEQQQQLPSGRQTEIMVTFNLEEKHF